MVSDRLELAARIAALEAEVKLTLEAYDDLRRYIYDKDADRREYSIRRFRERMDAVRAILQETNNG